MKRYFRCQLEKRPPKQPKKKSKTTQNNSIELFFENVIILRFTMKSWKKTQNNPNFEQPDFEKKTQNNSNFEQPDFEKKLKTTQI